MNRLSKKVDFLVELAMAEDEESRAAIKRDFASLMGSGRYEQPKGRTVREAVELVVQDLGIPSNLKAHRCIVSALCRSVENPDILNNVMEDLYRQVGQDCGTTPVCAERAIRHGVETSYNRADQEVLNWYFGNTVSRITGKPTNSHFIAQVAQHIRRQFDL